MDFGLTEEQIKEFQDILTKYEAIETALIFGDRATNTFKKNSNVEIALKGETLTPSICNSIQDKLNKTTAPYSFSTVSYQSIEKPELITHINQKGKIFYLKGWKKVKLKTISKKVGDGLHGTPQYNDNGNYFFINGNNLKNGHIIIKKETKRIELSDYLKYKKDLNEKTILLSINGTVGNLAKYRLEPCILGKSAAYIKIKDDTCHNFVYYLLSDRSFQHNISHNANGSTIKNVSLAQLREFPINLPPLAEQKAIAKMLSNFDEKIELLTEQNKTLESIAQLLFKRWFVDFEFPLSREEALALGNPSLKGQPYKSSGGPLKDSELGPIPKNWEVRTLGDILSVIESGSRPKGGIDSSLKEGIPSVGAESINGIGIFNQSNLKLIPKAFFEKMKRGKVQNKDVLIYKDGAYVGKKAMFGNGFPFEEFTINEHVFILRSNEFSSQFFLYFSLHEEELRILNTNSAQPGLNQLLMRSFELILPNKKKIKKFDNFSESLIDKLLYNAKQIQQLKKTRDTLLPKLISGQVRIKKEHLQ